jgi:hypothetical protein
MALSSLWLELNYTEGGGGGEGGAARPGSPAKTTKTIGGVKPGFFPSHKHNAVHFLHFFFFFVVLVFEFRDYTLSIPPALFFCDGFFFSK